MKMKVLRCALLLAYGLFLAQFGIANAQTATDSSSANVRDPGREIMVTADAWAWSPPDNARVSIQVEHTAPSAKEVSTAIEKISKELLDRLRADLGADATVNTQDISFTAPGTKDSKLSSTSAIRGTQVIGIETTKLERVSSAIDSALKSPQVAVLDVRYAVRSAHERRIAAISEATARARQKAERVASSLGVKLGGVIEATVIEEPAERTQRMERERGDIGALFHDEDAHVLVTVRYQIVP